MILSHISNFLIILTYVFLSQNLTLAQSQSVKVSFVNSSDKPLKIFWFDESAQSNVFVIDVPSYKDVGMNTEVGHIFHYTYEEDEKAIQVKGQNEVHVVGPNDVKVTCSSTSGQIKINVKPNWSPRGAGRFLELVDMGYFNGCALNRVVTKFLTQFGISANYELRTKFRTQTILDDLSLDIDFQPGFMSYAGSGADSRTSEVFIAMPGVSQNQLKYFGRNPWETPFGYVDQDDLSNVVDKWEAYGDIPPWGEGPDPQKIYLEDGYDYLKQDFPSMSYLNNCKIVTSSMDLDAEEL